LRVELLAFELPPGLIAQRPAATRDGSRMLHLGGGGALSDQQVVDLPSCLPEGALVVVNDTRVIPARLRGQKAGSGGAVELLLLRREGPGPAGGAERWLAIGRASKPLREGGVLRFGEGLEATVGRRREGGVIEVELVGRGASVDQRIEELGHMPLPPYVERADDESDRERYQTVFARVPGAAAAPTAGLHLSAAVLAELAARSIEVRSVTLHVGLGTFRPVAAADLDEHPMHEEWLDVPAETAQAVRAARARGAPVVAIGTTVVRALEAAAQAAGEGEIVAEGPRSTRILIQPGYTFRVVDVLFTNFHLPRSTLLALVAAFGGLGHVLGAYRHAVAAGYRFFSYGDAMLLSQRVAPGEASQ
jgi:S-adenosylmethionine:tRNA ribosyltransferase-isomerase